MKRSALRTSLALSGLGLFLGLALAACATGGAPSAAGKTAAVPAPAWYNDLASVYPDSQFLAAVGTADTLDGARQNALGQLAGFFGMTVNAVSTGTIEYADRGTGGKNAATESTLSRTVSQSVRTESTQKLYAVKYSEPYIQKTGVSVVAYLVIKDTLAQINAEKRGKVEAARHYLDQATGAASVLERHLNQLAAASLTGRLAELDGLLRALKAPVGSEVPSIQEAVRGADDAIRAGMNASIELDDPEKMVGNLLAEALSSLDIKPAAKGTLSLKAAVAVKPLKLATQSDLHTHEWTISLNLLDENATVWYASQASGRASGSSDDTAKLRCRLEIEKFIKNRFSKELLDKLLARIGGN
jgi:hypothetical protein